MTDDAVDRGAPSPEAETIDDEETLIGRVAADRRTDRETTKDVETPVRLAGDKNQAALDRPAK